MIRRLIYVSWLPCLLLVLSVVHPTRATFGKVGLFCNEEESANIDCMAGGLYNLGFEMFRGTFMCRETTRWFFFKRNETVCVPTFAGSVIGEAGDQCGCCGGECPVKCSCVCNYDDNYHVLVYKDGLFGRTTECLSQGKASRRVGNGEHTGYSCVPDEECPTLAPTMSPTLEPTETYFEELDFSS